MSRHSEESEKALERYLCERAKELGGLALKFASATQTGWPDRVVLLPGGRQLWVELKSKGRRPTELQWLRLQWLRRQGHRAFVCDSRASVEAALAASSAKAEAQDQDGCLFTETEAQDQDSRLITERDGDGEA